MFLDLSIDDAEKRGGFGQERYEKRELQIKVREEFMKLKEDGWKMIDASQTKDQVEQAIWNTVQEVRKSFDHSQELQFNLWKK